MTNTDVENIDLFIRYCEIVGPEIDPVDAAYARRLQEFAEQLDSLAKSDEDEPTKDLQYLLFNQQSRPFLNEFDLRVNHLVSQALAFQNRLS